MILLDTNLLTRLANPATPAFFHAAEVAIENVIRSGHEPCIVPQSLYEFWAVATRPLSANGLQMSVVQACKEIDTIVSLFHLLLDERAIFPRWRELVEKYEVHGKPTHDARLVAAMLRHGVTHLLTFNVGDFNRYAEITAIDPSNLLSKSDSLPAPGT